MSETLLSTVSFVCPRHLKLMRAGAIIVSSVAVALHHILQSNQHSNARLSDSVCLECVQFICEPASCVLRTVE